MANFLLGRDDWSTGATDVTSSTERSGFEAINLIKRNPADRYESDTPASHFIDIRNVENDNTKPILFVALLGTNAASVSADWRVTAGSTQGGTNGFDSGTVQLWSASDYDTAPFAHALHVETTVVTTNTEWVRITIEEPTVSIFRASRVIIGSGDPFELANYSYGSSYGGFEDRSSVRANSRGRNFVNRGYVARKMDVRFTTDQQSVADGLLELYEDQGGSYDVLAVRDRDASTRFEQGIINGLLSRKFLIEQPTFGFYRGRFEVTER